MNYNENKTRLAADVKAYAETRRKLWETIFDWLELTDVLQKKTTKELEDENNV